ncbi:radical SAM family heme chaperone HemW [Peptoniphilus equinus]|uniref:Heme chaperone HemW n=1 Tax=Peptoniphilus equinus TaxID=3016343 RepID=A0ABY7QU93_9FIRM|nr:radical SAM family heme chaperone HemW [Peptoniphilus equinus]WBW50359.1 radical SAM family heme chaperone HemW [Peptoniphilus equinus]
MNKPVTSRPRDFLSTRKQDLSLYIHIPFCTSKCSYCDFYSAPGDSAAVAGYFRALRGEIDDYADFLATKDIVSVFIGGGTPSAVPPSYLRDVLCHIESITPLTGAEITTEANPNSLTSAFVDTVTEAGVNRISLGIQSLNPKLLRLLGRAHTAFDAHAAAELVTSRGLNVSVDFMLGLPGQTPSDIDATLDFVDRYDIPHVSYYSLIVEEGTPLYAMRDRLPFLDDEADRALYHRASNGLCHMNRRSYELSNFAKPGFECRHNRRYWTLENYLGFGPTAAGNIDSLRYKNTASREAYIKGELTYEMEHLSTIDRINEWLILALRTSEGIDPEAFARRFGRNFDAVYATPLAKHLKRRTIAEEHGRYVLTDLGKDLANTVELDFFTL